MAPKRRRTTESENEQVAQQRSLMIKRAQSSWEKINNSNNLPVVVFAHGAGAPSSSEWMIRWKNLLADALNAVEVVTFDYPYISGKRKPPPKAEKLVEFHSDIVKKVAAKYPEHPLILVGKSMGSRVSCMVAAEDGIEASAVVCLGYPLKGTKGAIRDEPLLQLTVPTLFVQGSNDGLCPLKLLEPVRMKMKALSSLHVVENGDHSFKISKKNLKVSGITHEEAEEHAIQEIAIFVSEIIGARFHMTCSSGSGTQEFVTSKDVHVLDAYQQAMFERYDPNVGAHPPVNTELWEHVMGGRKNERFFGFGAPRDPELVMTSSLGSCSTGKSYVGSISEEVQQLKEKIQKMEEERKTELAAQEAERVARETERTERESQRKAEMKEMKGKLKTFEELLFSRFPPLPPS